MNLLHKHVDRSFYFYSLTENYVTKRQEQFYELLNRLRIGKKNQKMVTTSLIHVK